MPDPEIDAEDGEVRDAPPALEEKRDDKRKLAGAEFEDRSGKKHKSDRDRSRSRDRGRGDREKDREKRISYDQVSYSGDIGLERYDRYAAATADTRDAKIRKERGRDGRELERDDRSRRTAESERDNEVKDRDAKDRERRRDREEPEKRKDRDDRGKEADRDKEKDRRRDRERGREKERSRSRERTRPERDHERDKDYRRDDRSDQRRRSRSRDKNRSRELGDRHEERRKEKGNGGRDKDNASNKLEGEPNTPRGQKDTDPSHDDDLLQDDEEDLETIRKQRAAILAKIKNKAAVNGASQQPAAQQAPPPQQAPQQALPQKEDNIFEEEPPQTSEEPPPPPADAEEVEDKDEIDTANVFAAKERGESDADGEDDMFTSSPARAKNGGKPLAKDKEDGEERDQRDRSGLEEVRVDRRLGDTNADNWDDAEGYFRTRPGELIIGRYLVNRDIGNGVYSTVLSAADQQTGREVAIKVVRSNETMTVAGKKEIEILKKLGAEDPEGKRHICKLLSHFEYKNHLCMVFVPLEMNLRKLLKTYGREVGITLSAIRQYTRQLLIGLAHMVKCKVVHGDIKLDNIVITKDLKNVAICDFGTADWESECVITPYMVSRYYRPPEICLGHRYGYPMDLWSVGVCLFELYTGKFMFTGRSNNDMLKQFMDYKGAPNKRFLKKGQFFDQHFEEEKGQMVFKWLTQDKVTKAEIIEKKTYDKPVKSIYEQLRKVRSSSDDAKKVKEFADLLEQIFILDPLKRITVADALKHAFLR